MFRRFEKVYGIDLGTSNTVIFERGKGIVLNEPSVVAVHQGTGEMLAAGSKAQAMIGRAPDHVQITHPLRDGVIASFDMTSQMLKSFMKMVQGRSAMLRGSQVYISVPCGISEVQKRAVEETVVLKGAKKAIVIEEPLAAAIGAGLPIQEPIGHLVLDIGGGTSQVAILSLGGIVASHTMNRGGLAIDRDIIDYVKRKHNLEIGERTAEEIKKQIGTAGDFTEERSMEIRGRHVVDGLPHSIRINSKEVFSVMDGFLLSLVGAVRATIEQCPPELAGDVIEQGLLLCGGGALLEGIGERIRSETGVPVNIAERPLECVALGAGMLG